MVFQYILQYSWCLYTMDNLLAVSHLQLLSTKPLVIHKGFMAVLKSQKMNGALKIQWTWLFGWICWQEHLFNRTDTLRWFYAKRSWVSVRKWGAQIDEVLAVKFQFESLEDQRLHIHFGLLLVYTNGTSSKDSCPRMHTGLITQSCGFDVLVPNLLPGSEYLGAMVIKCHWNT